MLSKHVRVRCTGGDGGILCWVIMCVREVHVRWWWQFILSQHVRRRCTGGYGGILCWVSMCTEGGVQKVMVAFYAEPACVRDVRETWWWHFMLSQHVCGRCAGGDGGILCWVSMCTGGAWKVMVTFYAEAACAREGDGGTLCWVSMCAWGAREGDGDILCWGQNVCAEVCLKVMVAFYAESACVHEVRGRWWQAFYAESACTHAWRCALMLRCMEGVWEVRRRCTGGVWRVCGRVCPGVSFQLIR